MKKRDLVVIKATGEIATFFGYEEDEMQGALCVQLHDGFHFYTPSAVEPYVPETDETAKNDEWNLTSEQFLWLTDHWNMIQDELENGDDSGDLETLAESDVYRALFGDMNINEAIDRYQVRAENVLLAEAAAALHYIRDHQRYTSLDAPALEVIDLLQAEIKEYKRRAAEVLAKMEERK